MSFTSDDARRKRALLLGTSALILFGTLPVFAHHAGLGEWLPFAHMERWGALCLVALHLMLAPLHDTFHILLLFGFSYAVWDWTRGRLAMRRALTRVSVRAPVTGGRIWHAAWASGLDPRRVRVVQRSFNPVFTVGVLRPRVYLSATLASEFGDAELRSVLAHEAAHVRRRDPLRLALLRFFALTLFWLPALRRLSEDVALEAELEADADAAGDRPIVLANALVIAARTAARPLSRGFACGLIEPDTLEIRVRRLAGERAPFASRITSRSLIAAAAALLLTWSSGLIVAHPLPPESRRHMSSAVDCTEHGGWPFLHLFCGHFVPDQHCAHAGPVENAG